MLLDLKRTTFYEGRKEEEECARGWYYWINKKDKKEVELYVLNPKFVTAATFHLDRSLLNTEAEQNAAEVNTVVDVKQKRKHKKKQRKKEEEKYVRGWYYWINKEDKKEVELSVLRSMVVTAATFHLDRSPLNTEAW